MVDDDFGDSGSLVIDRRRSSRECAAEVSFLLPFYEVLSYSVLNLKVL